MIAAQLDTILIGSTVYARIINPANPAQVWDTNTQAFANRSGVTATNMAVSGTIDASGFFSGSEPTGFPAGLIADCTLHERVSGSPAATDPYVGGAVTNTALVATLTTTEQGRLDVNVGSRLASVSYTAPPSAAEIQAAVWAHADAEVVKQVAAALDEMIEENEVEQKRFTEQAVEAVASNFGVVFSATTETQALLQSMTETVDGETPYPRFKQPALEEAPTGDGGFTEQDRDTLASIESTVDDLAIGSVTIPINQVPVPLTRTWLLKHTDTGLRGELPLIRSVGESQLYAAEFANDLPNNGRLIDVESVVVISGPENGISIDADMGVDRSQCKFFIEALLVGTFEIEVACTYDDSDGGGTSIGVVTLIVK